MLPAAAQLQASQWYFGNQAALDFNTIQNAPIPLATSAMAAPEGCSSRADSLGNLLFYTNGETVWNRQHQVMTNGTGLGLSGQFTTSATQSLIVPLSGSTRIFYVFTPPAQGHAQALTYSVVDMSRQSGLGEVVQKNSVLLASSTERVAAVLHANHRDSWIIALGGNNNLCYAFRLTASGLPSPPVVSPDGFVHNSTSGGMVGQLKAAPNSRRLALAAVSASGYPTGLLELLDFDTRTGQITNPVLLTSPEPGGYYGVEFSPDGTKLYATKYLNTTPPQSPLYQYDLTVPGYNAANALLAGASLPNTGIKGSLQLGPDGRIYVARFQPPSAFLGVIALPNRPGAACAYQDQGQSLNARTSTLGLPSFMPHELWRLPPVGPVCQGVAQPFALPPGYDADSVRWDFGDPASGVANQSRLSNPTHTYATPGAYTVALTLYFPEGGRQVLRTALQVAPRPVVDLGPDFNLCLGTVRRLAVPETAGAIYRWQDGSAGPAFTVRAPGRYWVTVANAAGCQNSDTVHIGAASPARVRLGADTVVCVGEVLRLHPRSSGPGLGFRWQDGSTQETFTVRTPGTYWVEATNSGGCSQRDSVRITYLTPPALHLGGDTAVCADTGPPLVLDVTLPGVRYRWQDGSTNPTFTPTQTGTYWVTVSTSVCTATDSIRVRLFDCPASAVLVPNIITPNGDGRNDRLIILGLGSDPWALTIYNRWGLVVYTTPRYQQDWAAPGLPDGVYFYHLRRPAAPSMKGWLEVRR
ncbi:MAG TPA: gliding motility-associated C-terminal domain-containing protein [Hymenobacter sp.]|uniref:T9SS type B sorting domain-containing protein n=1 Tax=Hymenobacter sp. TaxID=1898978 RepID=UPI002EDADA20